MKTKILNTLSMLIQLCLLGLASATILGFAVGFPIISIVEIQRKFGLSLPASIGVFCAGLVGLGLIGRAVVFVEKRL